MDNPMRVVIALASSAILTAAFAGGCEPENDNAVKCAAGDCAASCAAKGFASGSCVDEKTCRCDGTDATAYAWEDSPGQTDAGPDAN